MAQFFESLNQTLTDFIRRQPVFFVATAATQGRINLSPKGLDSLRVLNDRTVSYLDITGSGAETAAHVRHDGRLTFMFCSFDEKPLILRLYGRGEVVRPNDSKWNDLIGQFTRMPGERQIVVLHIESAQTSCGFGVPRMQLVEHRTDLTDWAMKKGEQGLVEYRARKNSRSIDGLATGIGSQDAPSKERAQL
jgi:hypothetical protein